MLVSLVQSALQRCTSLLFRMLGAIIGRDVGGAGPAVDGTAAAGASGAAQVAGNSATDDGDWNLTLVDPLAELAEPLKSRESRRVQGPWGLVRSHRSASPHRSASLRPRTASGRFRMLTRACSTGTRSSCGSSTAATSRTFCPRPPEPSARALTSSRPSPEFVCIGSTIAAHKFATRPSTWAEATANRVRFAHRFSRTLAAETRLGAGFLSHPWTASTITHPPVRLACNGQAAIYPLADADAPVEQLGQDTEAMVVRIERCDCGPVLAMRRRHTHTAASSVRGRSPPVLEWSPRAHAAFPDVFRSAVQTFILCHATLAAVSEDASSPRRVCTLGSLPVVLRDVIIGKAAPRIPSWAPIRLPRPETPVAQDDDQ